MGGNNCIIYNTINVVCINTFIYELFIDGMTYVNELLKKNSING